jgi:ElaA protein
MQRKINWKIKRFNELSLLELYSLLQLRAEVFVVEQNCVYQDIDGKDEKALHLIGEFEEKTVAYCRLFNASDYFDNCSIGRVVTSPACRSMNFGNELMVNAIDGIKSHFGKTAITISAQLYLKKFYENHGFVQTSETYLEDDIEHIEMRRE